MRQGPLAGRYPAVAAMVAFALVPYLVLSAALQPLTPIISKQLHMSSQTMNLTLGMANAAYAVGTVLAVQLALRLPQRRMLLIYGVLLVIGSVLAASATTPGVFIAGHVLQGLCTSLLLIAALPPLIVGYPVAKARWTAMILNLCIFGAVALGPVVGGIQASAHAWRPLFWIVVGIAVAALVLSILTFIDAPPADPTVPVDPLAIGLAAGGCVAAFFGASELLTHRFLDPLTLGLLLIGLTLIVVLLVAEYRGRCKLLEVRPLVSTLPVTGILMAMCAAAASVSAVALTGSLLPQRYTSLHVGLLYLPEFGGAMVSAIVFGVVFRKRALHYFVLAGLILLSAGIVVIGRVIPPTAPLTLVGSGLIGIGVGSSVAPALYLVSYSVRSSGVQRVVAIVELLRAVAAFMIAPILLHFASTVESTLNAGTTVVLWICFGLSAGGALVGVCLYVLGGVRPPTPAFERWLTGEGPAFNSPRLLAGVRRPSTEVSSPEGVADADARNRQLLRSLSAACGPPGPPSTSEPSVLDARQAERGSQADVPDTRNRAEIVSALTGPVVFAYDGSDLAKAAIVEAGRQLTGGRQALVLTVWQPYNVGFIAPRELRMDAAAVEEVRDAAAQTAAQGAALAQKAGFEAKSMAIEGAPTWKGIVETADEQDSSLIVLGSRGRSGLADVLIGSVAEAVVAHSRRAVLIVHRK